MCVSCTRQDPVEHVEKLRRLIHQTGDHRRLRHCSCSCFYFSPITSLHFFCCPSDVPGGFIINQEEEPREGRDLHLTCVANKYLYTAVSWQQVNDTEDVQSRGSALMSSQQFTSGEYSNSLVLLLSNLTARDSGAYRCSARHLVTGQETHLDTQVVVTSESSQFNGFLFILIISRISVILHSAGTSHFFVFTLFEIFRSNLFSHFPFSLTFIWKKSNQIY